MKSNELEPTTPPRPSGSVLQKRPSPAREEEISSKHNTSQGLHESVGGDAKENSPSSVAAFPDFGEFQGDPVVKVEARGAASVSIFDEVEDKPIDVMKELGAKKGTISRILRVVKGSQDISDSGLEMSEEAFADIARGVAEYSKHNRTQSVRYNQESKKLETVGLTGDRARDIEDDKTVARNYTALHDKIKHHATQAIKREDDAAFMALGTLHHELNTLPADNCNQDNAKVFAELLNKYSPIKMPVSSKISGEVEIRKGSSKKKGKSRVV